MNNYLESTPTPLRVSLTEGLRVMCDPSLPLDSRVVGARFIWVTLQYLLHHVVCPQQTAVLHQLYELTSLQADFDVRVRDFIYLLHDEVLNVETEPYFRSLCHSIATAIESAVGDYQYYGLYIRD